ncbi:MAG: endonuclease/exonuclease/phosphatase family protein [Ignavibacteriales bacterium]
MKPIQLLYVKNIISRHRGDAQQDLVFFMLVENLAYDKQVEVHWAGEDGVWRTLPAEYHSATGQSREIWYAQAKFYLSEETLLPGDIEFALRYRVLGKEYWDNNYRQNYAINADSGVQVAQEVPLLNIEFNPMLQHGQQFYPITVAVRHSLQPKGVYIHWTTDHWESVHTTPCFFKRKHWDKTLWSNARNPNKYGYGIWISQIKVDDAYRVEYAIACETATRTIWDNNFGQNYLTRRELLKVLILNLHCYQEENQDAKFTQIAKAISDLNIDIACLQEVGEHWNDGRGDWNSNAAKIICGLLREPYHLYTDWCHIGFGRYREGVAILSKYKFVTQDAFFVSSSQDIYDIHARKIVMAQVHVPYMGLTNVLSVHLSWLSDGFLEQFERLRGWANHKHANNVAATLLCGDFNIKAGSEGYAAVVNTQEYEDQFLRVTSQDVFDKIFRQSSQPWDHYLANDHRIDYIFMKKGSNLMVTSARPLFTEHDYGRVSDHYGYYMEFEPKC